MKNNNNNNNKIIQMKNSNEDFFSDSEDEGKYEPQKMVQDKFSIPKPDYSPLDVMKPLVDATANIKDKLEIQAVTNLFKTINYAFNFVEKLFEKTSDEENEFKTYLDWFFDVGGKRIKKNNNLSKILDQQIIIKINENTQTNKLSVEKEVSNINQMFNLHSFIFNPKENTQVIDIIDKKNPNIVLMKIHITPNNPPDIIITTPYREAEEGINDIIQNILNNTDEKRKENEKYINLLKTIKINVKS